MKLSSLFYAVVFTTLSYTAAAQKLADPILLWPAGAPGAGRRSRGRAGE